MPDIYLYAGESNPNDIRLSDPTTIRTVAIVYVPAQTGSVSSVIVGIGKLSLVGGGGKLIKLTGLRKYSVSGNVNLSSGTVTTLNVSVSKFLRTITTTTI